MSEANVEAAQHSFEAWASGGFDVLVEYLDPDIEWTLRPDFPDAGTFRGHDKVRGLFKRFEETFEHLGSDPLEFIDAGDQVVVPLHWWGRGKASGAEVAERQGETWVITVRDGKATKVTEYRTKEEALEAVELSE
jgi:ketosteroid isomerase-like protein